MRPGYALFIRRSAPFSARSAAEAVAGVIRLITDRKLVLAAAISVSFVLAARAQESIPPWSEPTLPSAEPTSSAAVEPAPPAPEALPSIPEEPLPSSSEAVPSSEEAFPTTPDPWSSSTNFTTAQTSVVGAPAAGGPYGGFNTKNIAVGEGPASSEPRRFYYGLQFTVRGVWDDNIFISNTNRVSDYYFAIEPQLTLGVGDVAGRSRSYLRLDYMPSGILFVDHSDEDAFNQLIHLEGGYDAGRLRLSLFEDIALLQSANLNSIIDTTGLWANLDASAPTRLNIFNTRLRADYDLTGKLFLQGELDSYIYFYPNNISDYTVSGGLYLYYNWMPKLSVGVGGTFGYDWVDNPTTNQTFEQVNARLNYQATAKLGVYASAGCEFRQFDGNRGTYTTPVFEVGLEHHPFEGTLISLAAGRRMYNSGFLANQDFANTYIVGRFQQRLFRRLYLGLGGGYENSDYFATTNNVSAPRNDDYWFIEPSLDVLITRWLSTGVYYLHREDSSNISFFSFDDNQVGVRATVRF
ncbi:MAG: outer membrane beta-barrel protein [Alphaproteobacteria bacterium]